MTYPPYNPAATCKKCGASAAGTKWALPLAWTYNHEPPPYNNIDLPERLTRTCNCCGYRWHEQCLDTIDAEKKE